MRLIKLDEVIPFIAGLVFAFIIESWGLEPTEKTDLRSLPCYYMKGGHSDKILGQIST